MKSDAALSQTNAIVVGIDLEQSTLEKGAMQRGSSPWPVL
jgi:hypothetical protein